MQPLIGNLYNGYINPYYWVDDHPLLYGNNGSLDPGTDAIFFKQNGRNNWEIPWFELVCRIFALSTGTGQWKENNGKDGRQILGMMILIACNFAVCRCLKQIVDHEEQKSS